jgi:hypothetical protein
VPKLPLNIGLPLLVLALLIAGYYEFGPERSVALAVVIALALWMAYSLAIRPHEEVDEEQDEDEPAIDDPDPASEEPLRPLTEAEQKELEHEAERHRPYRKP